MEGSTVASNDDVYFKARGLSSPSAEKSSSVGKTSEKYQYRERSCVLSFQTVLNKRTRSPRCFPSFKMSAFVGNYLRKQK